MLSVVKQIRGWPRYYPAPARPLQWCSQGGFPFGEHPGADRVQPGGSLAAWHHVASDFMLQTNRIGAALALVRVPATPESLKLPSHRRD